MKLDKGTIGGDHGLRENKGITSDQMRRLKIGEMELETKDTRAKVMKKVHV